VRTLLLFLTLAAPAPSDAVAPRLALLDDVKTSPAQDNVHREIRDVVARIASERGMVVVATERGCADEACARKAVDADADLVIAVAGAYTSKDHLIDVRLFHGSERRWTEPEPRQDHCFARCSLGRVIDHVKKSVDALLTTAPPATKPKLVAESPPVPILDVSDTRPTPPAAPARTSLALPLSLAIGGAALIGGGVVVWGIDGKKTNCMGNGGPCSSQLATAGLGKTLVGVGSAAVLGGAAVYFFRRDRRESSVAFALSPSGVFVRGGF
jgi:hypothetical protein